MQGQRQPFSAARGLLEEEQESEPESSTRQSKTARRRKEEKKAMRAAAVCAPEADESCAYDLARASIETALLSVGRCRWRGLHKLCTNKHGYSVTFLTREGAL